MRRRITTSVAWRYFLRGLVLLGAGSSGAIQLYTDYIHVDGITDPVLPVEEWDWSIPHVWYDLAH
ncbi:hypothetical protein [Nocardia sp. alder85J]|uniref:hypothetical protein n=1 Tax=Nocardia sp. alder85J TaxID=2862949 RepID=UPI001CD1BA51|nr:hypothetical protein [Nocardia sp. alder85J]MCX4092593.1 hypothetical protein [Nocardia sp. alder85J]